MKFFGMVTTRSSAAYTPFALKSFFEWTPLDRDDRFYLIDNDGSENDSVGAIPAVTRITNPSPLGFAANVNQVIRLAASHQADIFFLNNDLIFTPNWIEPLKTSEPAIISPMSNWQHSYRAGDFNCSRMMDLSEYLGHEKVLNAIAAEHGRRNQGLERQFTIWFFCIKIPYAVHSNVGELDESFGRGGAEDIDYCLRCHMAGFPVCWARSSFVLHFMGKSTWRGTETPQARADREQIYKTAFVGKWGDALANLTIHGDDSAEIQPGVKGGLFPRQVPTFD